MYALTLPDRHRAQPPARSDRDHEPELLGSIFHQHWWLDIATDHRWGEAVVRENGAVIARLPYPIRSKYGMLVSTLPSLIRTLGPAIRPLPGKASTVFRRRQELIYELIGQFPSFAHFDHCFDPGFDDGTPFVFSDFVLGAAYCFRIGAGRSSQEIWTGMTDRRRRVIRRAGDEFTTAPIADVEEFARFYEANLGSAVNIHGHARMRTLLQEILRRDSGTIIGARDAAGKLIAAVTLVWDAQAMYYLLGTRSENSPDNGAKSLLLWTGIQDANARGLSFDCDGAISPGMVQFLAGFGGSLTPRLRVRKTQPAYRVINAVETLVHRAASATRIPMR